LKLFHFMVTSFTLVFINRHDGPHQLFASWSLLQRLRSI
jgi:hypothetical protein